MARKGFAEKIKKQFGIDYEALLTKLRFTDERSPQEISEWLKITYGKNFHPSPGTIAKHLSQIGSKKLGRKSVAARLLDQGVTDYRSLLESLSTLSFQKISDHFREQFDISVSPLTIESHFKDLLVEHKIPSETKDEKPSVDYSDRSLLINKDLPLERLFNGTPHLGYLQLSEFPRGIFKLESKLIVTSRSKAKIELAIQAFKGTQVSGTKVLHEEDVSSVLSSMTDSNFTSLCKEAVGDFVSVLEKMKEKELENLFLKNTEDVSQMRNILEGSVSG